VALLLLRRARLRAIPSTKKTADRFPNPRFLN